MRIKKKKFQTSHYDILQDYLQSGCSLELNDEEMEYYQTLYMMVGISKKYGKDNAISFLQHPPLGVERGIAQRMYSEAINLFYLNDTIENNAHRNMLYESLIKASQVVLQNAKNSKDMEVYGNLITQASRIKGLDKEDPEKPREIEDKHIKIYSLDSSAIGLPSANRNEVAELIDSLEDVSVSDKTRLKRDAQVMDIDIEEVLDDQEKKTKNY